MLQVVPTVREAVPQIYVDLVRRLVTARPTPPGQQPAVPPTWDSILDAIRAAQEELQNGSSIQVV